MKTIIFCLLIILVFSGYMAFTSDNKKIPAANVSETVQSLKNNQTSNEYIVEIIEEEEDE